jgi:hypothetical protein
VIQNPHIDQCQGVTQAMSDLLARLRWFCNPGRMVVRQYHRRCVATQRFIDHLARVDGGAVDGTAKQRHEFDQAVAVVEEEDREHFVVVNGEVLLSAAVRGPTGRQLKGEGRAGGLRSGASRRDERQCAGARATG